MFKLADLFREALGVRTACPPVYGRPRVAFELDDVLRKVKPGRGFSSLLL
jgi:hypothetical protein